MPVLVWSLVLVLLVVAGALGRLPWVPIKTWQWMLLAAIPVVVLFFSYIYAVSALVGVATRSSIAAILAAALFWLAIWAVQSAEQVSLTIATQFTAVAEIRDGSAESSLSDGAVQSSNAEQPLRKTNRPTRPQRPA